MIYVSTGNLLLWARTGMGLQKSGSKNWRRDLGQDSSLFLNFQFSSDKHHYPT